uniref:Uncharacterized protein n=1 Tax=Steinernema glaseri TaxID=37863 RepID=A0A1I8A428_9BILA
MPIQIHVSRAKPNSAQRELNYRLDKLWLRAPGEMMIMSFKRLRSLCKPATLARVERREIQDAGEGESTFMGQTYPCVSDKLSTNINENYTSR